jgi:hypothetical protein
MTVVEDTAILDSNLDIVSSRTVRQKIMSEEPIAQYLGDLVESYVKSHRIGLKMTGGEKWTLEEKRLPEIASRPFDPYSSLSSGSSFLSSPMLPSPATSTLSQTQQTNDAFAVNIQDQGRTSASVVVVVAEDESSSPSTSIKEGALAGNSGATSK